MPIKSKRYAAESALVGGTLATAPGAPAAMDPLGGLIGGSSMRSGLSIPALCRTTVSSPFVTINRAVKGLMIALALAGPVAADGNLFLTQASQSGDRAAFVAKIISDWGMPFTRSGGASRPT